MGTSSFSGKTFTPGVKASGGAMTKEDEVRRLVSEYFRKAWDAAVDTHTLVRGVRKAARQGKKAAFAAKKPLLLEISKLMDLSIHHQVATKARVTPLDVTVSESIARSVSHLGSLASREAYPKQTMWFLFMIPMDITATFSNDVLRDMMIDATIKKYKHLLGDPTRDRALLDWFVAHYRSVL